MKPTIFRSAAAFIILTVCSSYIYGIFGKKSGIQGYVYEVKGNQMPSPGEKPAAPKGIVTEVFVYELTGQDRVVKADRPGFYKAINSKLIKKTTTDEKGWFKIKLSPGNYSVFTKVDSLFYANIFDMNNRIYPVQVERKKMTEMVIKQDYGAAY